LPNHHEPAPVPAPVKERVLEGAGGPSHVENGTGHPTGSAHPGNGTPPTSMHPGDGSHPTGGGTHNTPPTGGHATDHPTGGHPTGDGSSGGAGSHTPSVGGHGTTGGGGHQPGGSGHGGADNAPHDHHTEPGGGGGTGHGEADTAPTGGGHGEGPGIPHEGEVPGGPVPDGPLGTADDGVLPGGSEPRPDGARYIEEPTDSHVQAARFYDDIRANPENLNIAAISDNTGISPQVLDRVRTHFFLTEHVVAEAPGLSRNGYFTPRSDIAEIWEAASRRSLTPEETTKFERYIGHEYVESQLLEAGLPYTVDAPHMWDSFQNSDGPVEYYHEFPRSPRDAGAHDLAVNEGRGGFNHWRAVGFDVPKIELASDLSNIDEVVAALKDELRAKGIELK
ncbi:hypothetical protein ACWGAU_35980, partial [Streptomyces sp. NPDC054952]